MAGEFDMLAFDRATDALGTAADRLLHVHARRRAALLRFMLPNVEACTWTRDADRWDDDHVSFRLRP